MATTELAESIATHARGCTYMICQADGTVGSNDCQSRIRAKVSNVIGISRAENISNPDALGATVQFARVQCRCEANKKKTQEIKALSRKVIENLKH